MTSEQFVRAADRAFALVEVVDRPWLYLSILQP